MDCPLPEVSESQARELVLPGVPSHLGSACSCSEPEMGSRGLGLSLGFVVDMISDQSRIEAVKSAHNKQVGWILSVDGRANDTLDDVLYTGCSIQHSCFASHR